MTHADELLCDIIQFKQQVELVFYPVLSAIIKLYTSSLILPSRFSQSYNQCDNIQARYQNLPFIFKFLRGNKKRKQQGK